MDSSVAIFVCNSYGWSGLGQYMAGPFCRLSLGLAVLKKSMLLWGPIISGHSCREACLWGGVGHGGSGQILENPSVSWCKLWIPISFIRHKADFHLHLFESCDSLDWFQLEAGRLGIEERIETRILFICSSKTPLIILLFYNNNIRSYSNPSHLEEPRATHTWFWRGVLLYRTKG